MFSFFIVEKYEKNRQVKKQPEEVTAAGPQN